MEIKMPTTRMYNKSGKTILSSRGTAVKRMCVAVLRAEKDIKSGKAPSHGRLGPADVTPGSVKLGYERWSNGHPHMPVGYGRFSVLVANFLPLLKDGNQEAFRLIDKTDMSYTDACIFGSEVTAMTSVSRKHGIRFVLTQ